MLVRSKYSGSSFSELLDVEFPHLRFENRLLQALPAAALAAGQGPAGPVPTVRRSLRRFSTRRRRRGGRSPHDQRLSVASRDVQKVYTTDAPSLIAIAVRPGVHRDGQAPAGSTQHYRRSKASLELRVRQRLSRIVQANLSSAIRLVVVPFRYDPRRRVGRLWKYDVTGGRYEEAEFEATGSGGLYARESLKKLAARSCRDEGLRMAVAALMDAADEDRGTGGIDLQRGIYPTLSVCSISKRSCRRRLPRSTARCSTSDGERRRDVAFPTFTYSPNS